MKLFLGIIFIVFSTSLLALDKIECEESQEFIYKKYNQYQIVEKELRFEISKRKKKFRVREFMNGKRKTKRVDPNYINFDDLIVLFGSYLFDLYPKLIPHQVEDVLQLNLSQKKKLGTKSGRGIFVLLDKEEQPLGIIFWYGANLGTCI